MMFLSIFLDIAYAYDEFFTCLNGIFTCLGQVDSSTSVYAMKLGIWALLGAWMYGQLKVH